MAKQMLKQRRERADIIAKSANIEEAFQNRRLKSIGEISLSEAVILGLIRQQVRKFIGIFGHGSTDVAEVLRVYEEAGVVKTYAVRHETEAVHAATALRWVTGEKSAVVTSIGPGALHALAGSLAPCSIGMGIWFLLGDETTEDEGPNMQQIPGNGQNGFHRLFSAMGSTYTLHTPEAIGTAMRRGLAATEHPYRPQPFFLLLPMNTQPQLLKSFNTDELPENVTLRIGPADPSCGYDEAVEALMSSRRIVVKVGGGAGKVQSGLLEFLELTDAVAVSSPLVPGLIPFSHERNMTVGGSKGSISGNFAMEEADMLVAIGTRFVCQSDCSRTAYPKVKRVLNINADIDAALHYSKTIALPGDIQSTLLMLNSELIKRGAKPPARPSSWFKTCRSKRNEWDKFRNRRYTVKSLYDERWKRKVLTQPVVIKTASDWALSRNIISFFDAGDVQANGFQIVEPEKYGRVYTETGASYMGFAVSALLSTAMSEKSFYGLAFTGDGSFTMNPQILIDGVQHGARGCILLMDNRRMAAISGLQQAQYGREYATFDDVEVDYLSWATSIKGVHALDAGYSKTSLLTALDEAWKYDGLSMVYVRVYYGDDDLGDMGVFGRWNVGNWCEETQALRHKTGL